MTGREQLQLDLQAVADAAARARHAVDAGELVDLGSLEALVDRLAAAAPTLDEADAESLRNAVLLLIAELDELRELVRAEHETLRRELEGTGTRRSAAAAYGQLPNRRR